MEAVQITTLILSAFSFVLVFLLGVEVFVSMKEVRERQIKSAVEIQNLQATLNRMLKKSEF